MQFNSITSAKEVGKIVIIIPLKVKVSVAHTIEVGYGENVAP